MGREASQQFAQRFDQPGAGGTQLLPVAEREALQLVFSLSGEPDADLPPVVGGPDALHQLVFFQTVDQADGAMMAYQQPIGNLADGGTFRCFQRTNRQQELVLLGFEPFLAGSEFAESQEMADAVAQFPQSGVVAGTEDAGIAGHELYRTTI